MPTTVTETNGVVCSPTKYQLAGLNKPAGEYAVPKPWGRPAEGRTFNADYPTEFKPSQIQGGGFGWWAKVDIPAGVRLRQVSVADGTLHRFANEEELRKTGWEVDDLVNYGIAHKSDRDAIFFLNPGTMMNHADPSRTPAVQYNMDRLGRWLWNNGATSYAVCGSVFSAVCSHCAVTVQQLSSRCAVTKR